MRFFVTRTAGGEPPHDGVIKGELVTVTQKELTSTWRNRKQFPSGSTGRSEARWFMKGTNHRKEGEYMLRDVTILNEDRYWVDIADLDALLEFAADHGEIIITSSDDDWALEIYDGYRE